MRRVKIILSQRTPLFPVDDRPRPGVWFRGGTTFIAREADNPMLKGAPPWLVKSNGDGLRYGAVEVFLRAWGAHIIELNC